MKKYFSLVTVSLLAMAMVFTMPLKASAASTDQADEKLDAGKTNTLTVVYNAGDDAFQDTAIQLYRVADFSADYKFTLTEGFAASGLDLNNLESSDQWSTVADTLDAYVKGNSVASVGTFTVSGTNTTAKFDNLTAGWYFIPQVVIVCENEIRTFSSVIATLPTVQDRKWVYSVETKPKSETVVPTYKDVNYFITVVWNDNGVTKYRPDSVVAHITHTVNTESEANVVKTSVSSTASSSSKALAYGFFGATPLVSLLSETGDAAPSAEDVPSSTVKQDVNISSAMNWHYEWTTKDDGTVWNVTGENVPHYTLTTKTVDHGWILEYKLNPIPQPDPIIPRTGEEFPWLAVVLLSVSGVMLVVFGIVSRRKAHDR